MSNIVEVPFRGETVQAAREGERVFVVVKRVCESLGLDDRSQRKKLQSKPWAVGVFITSTGPDGKNYQVFALELCSLPMWLATIEPSRVRPEVREKLIAYQRECHDVLRDHFFGRPRDSSTDVADLVRQVLAQALPELLRVVDQRIEERVAASVGTMSFGVVRPWELGAIKRRLSAAADLAVAANAYPARRSAMSGLTMRVRTACGWTGTGAHLNRMPASMLPYAERELCAIEREFQRVGNVRQLRFDVK